MAKRKFRIESLGTEDRRVIQQLTQYDPEALDEIEKTGKLPQRLANKFSDDPNGLTGLNNILSKLPSAKDAFQKFIDQGTGKEADLTDDELRDRIEAFKGLGGNTGTLDHNKIQSTVFNKLKAMEVPDDNGRLVDISNAIANLTEQLGHYPSPQEFEPIIKKFDLPVTGTRNTNVDYALRNFTNDQQTFNDFQLGLDKGNFSTFKDEDVSESVKRIQDILDTRAAEAGKEATERSFLAETPTELAGGRRRFLAEREPEIERFLVERAGPRALENLNVRGLAEGPDLASELAAEAGRQQVGLEDTLRTLEAEDEAFYAEAAFRLHTARLEQSEADFRSSVAAEREGVRTGQFRRFESAEKDTQRQFELALLRREAGRNLSEKQSELEIGKSGSRDELISGLTSDIATSTAQIVAGKIVYGGGNKKQPSPSFKEIG